MGSALRRREYHGSRPCRMSLIRQTLKIYRLLTDREMDVEIGVNGDRGDVRMWNRIIDRTTETKWDLLISSRTQNSNDVCISPGIQGNGRLLNI